jgi:single-strand DNA-binding protein
MANFNKVLLLGNLTRDPQLSYLPSQTAVVDFGLAVNRTWTSKEGTKKEETCFVDCRAFGKQAETIQKYCQKGKQLLVEGRLTFSQWTAQDGSKHSKHRVTVENFQFVGAPSGGSGGARPAAAGHQDGGNAPVDNEPGPQGFDDGGDEIPF